MYLGRFKQSGFRNLAPLDLEFDPHVNVFLGENAQGKTNLLEAIYFLALSRSHRTSNDREMIAFGQDFASLAGRVHKRQLDLDLRIVISKKGKSAWVNRVEQARLSKYVGHLNAILFSPEDLELVKGAPSLRRRFMDLEFGQINPEYLYFASQYRQLLQQRNNYLKQLARRQASDQVLLGVLTEQVATAASELIWRRYRYLAAPQPLRGRGLPGHQRAKRRAAGPLPAFSQGDYGCRPSGPDQAEAAGPLCGDR